MWIVLLCLAYIFGISESILAVKKRSKKSTVKTRKDSGSLVALYVVFTISMTAGFFLAHFRSRDMNSIFFFSVGVLVYILGLVIRWTSIFQLKKAFTVDVAINQNHELKTTGMYRFVRHPSYLGLVMIFFGLSIGMNSLLSVLVVTVPVFLVISYRINVEEKLMLNEFGQEYVTYMKSTKRLIPGIY